MPKRKGFKEMSEKFRTSIGGQALVEGVMMRGPDKVSVVVRKPDGELYVDTHPYVPITKKYKICGLPFIRGIFVFGSSMKVGVSSLMKSAEFVDDSADEEKGKFTQWAERTFGEKTINAIISAVAIVLGVALPIGLFILLPTLLAGLLGQWIGSGIGRSLLEGVLRIAVFVLYLKLVSLMSDMKRVFSYHGAEHKSIHCYEAGEELVPENIRKFPRQHPRCGTSFLFVVMIISILVFSIVRWDNALVRMALRIVLLPVVVSLSYEINSWVGKHDNALTRILRAPGLWLQDMTTCEPDDSMLEVAAKALTEVRPEEEGVDHI